MQQILIVEDDHILNQTLTYNLVSEGYRVDSAYTLAQARELFQPARYGILLLDINLPDGSGLKFCEEIKAVCPAQYILFLTANDRESDMLRGYEAGGADYVTKPFSVAVLCRKVAAVFASLQTQQPRHDIYEDSILRIDFSAQTASVCGHMVEFTPMEYRTLNLFVKNSGIILTKRKLLETLWDADGDFVDEHTLTIHHQRHPEKD